MQTPAQRHPRHRPSAVQMRAAQEHHCTSYGAGAAPEASMLTVVLPMEAQHIPGDEMVAQCQHTPGIMPFGHSRRSAAALRLGKSASPTNTGSSGTQAQVAHTASQILARAAICKAGSAASGGSAADVGQIADRQMVSIPSTQVPSMLRGACQGLGSLWCLRVLRDGEVTRSGGAAPPL